MSALEVEQPSFISPKQAAAILQVSMPTIWRYLRDGNVRSCLIGRSRRIPLAEIERLLKSAYEPEEVEKQ